jgi:hypothetical protein
MVKAPHYALALVATGCLSKPAAPIDGGAQDTQDAADGSLNPDAAGACIGRTALPADLVLRNVAVYDVDQRDQGSADDVLVWGRVGNGTGQAFAYLMSGHPQMTGNCYDRRFEFLNPADVEPIAAWMGEITGDTSPDVLLLGTETQAGNKREEIVLYAGDATQVPVTQVSIGVPFGNEFFTPWGNTLAEPYPSFVVGWKQTAAPTHHVFTGGLYPNPATIEVTTNPVNFGSALAAQNPSADPITPAAVQNVFVHPDSVRDELIMITQSDVLRVQFTNAGDGKTFVVNGTAALAPPGQRSARFARRPVSIEGTTASLGLTQIDSGGYQLIRVAGAPATPPTIDVFATATLPAQSRDMAIAFIDGDPRPDLVALVADATPGTVLQVYANLNFTQTPPGSGAMRSVRLTDIDQTAGAPHYNFMAIGDFDGAGGMADQILVMSAAPGLLPTKCYVLTSVLTPCP